jgi:hypothetical protein
MVFSICTAFRIRDTDSGYNNRDVSITEVGKLHDSDEPRKGK